MKLHTALLVSLLGFLATTPAVRADEPHSATASKEAHAGHMLEGYAVVATALYKDDLDAAKKAAAGMVKHDKDSAMSKSCQAIADSTSLEEARRHFKELSDVAIPIAREKKTMHEMNCPMALDGQGASWLQKSDDEIQNPYLGTRMPHCGEAVK